MRVAYRSVRVALTAVLLTGAVVRAQQPPAPAPAPARGGGTGAQGRGGRGGVPAGQTPAVPAVSQISSRPPVDAAALSRGQTLWATHCVTCHGTQARGTDTGPNIIRSNTVNFDRSSFTPGSVLGPYLKAGHPTQSGKSSATFTDDEVVGLAHFLRQKVNDTMRGTPLFTVGDIVVGDAKAGEAYFNGAGGCAACHTATTRSLAGISGRFAPVDLQQRFLFPSGGGRGGRGGPAAGPNPDAITVTVTPSSGPSISGVLVEQSDFYVTLREADSGLRVMPRAGARVVITNPLQAHIDLLDRITDKQIHDVVAYLETLK